MRHVALLIMRKIAYLQAILPICAPVVLRYKSQVTFFIMTSDTLAFGDMHDDTKFPPFITTVFILMVILVGSLSDCRGKGESNNDHDLAMASLDEMPAEVKRRRLRSGKPINSMLLTQM
jgi:hypothetical protein